MSPGFELGIGDSTTGCRSFIDPHINILGRHHLLRHLAIANDDFKTNIRNRIRTSMRLKSIKLIDRQFRINLGCDWTLRQCGVIR